MPKTNEKPKVSDVFPDAQLARVSELLRESSLQACKLLVDLKQDLANDIFEIPKKIRPFVKKECQTEEGNLADIVTEIVVKQGERRTVLAHALQSALPALRQDLSKKGFGGLEIIAAQLVAQGILILD